MRIPQIDGKFVSVSCAPRITAFFFVAQIFLSEEPYGPGELFNISYLRPARRLEPNLPPHPTKPRSSPLNIPIAKHSQNAGKVWDR